LTFKFKVSTDASNQQTLVHPS